MDFKFSKSDLYLILLYFAFAIPLSMLDYAAYDEKWKLWMESLYYAIILSLSAYVIVFVLFARFIPRRQYLLLFITTTSFVFLMGIIEINLQCLIYQCNDDPMSLLSIYYGFASHVENVGLLAAILLGKKVYETQLYYANIEKEKKSSELRFLKTQIDPHFLFNNLNTVDALIDKDPKAAKIYINKLAELYRYLITSKDFEVVPLEEELTFAQNYMYLIQSRYGNAYQFKIVNEKTTKEELLIPPGSLQTLLENIVKHNQGSEKTPIKSTIRINDEGISVSNDLRAKSNQVDSTGIGLENLRARYALLTDEVLQIQSNGKFEVALPLIKQVD